jgi:DNA modification methylase
MKIKSKNIAEVLGRATVHPFPARMAASVALSAVSRSRTRLKVLDPMMGSGTVLAVAQSKGHFARGVDIDPLAALIGRVWTTAVDTKRIRKKATKLLTAAKKDFLQRSAKSAYPRNADSETRKFVQYWFDPHARRQLASLSNEIIKCRNKTDRDVLWCAFSRLIITKQSGASLARDLSHSRPHKFFETAPRKPFSRFMDSVEEVLSNCLSLTQKKRGPATHISLGDARNLSLRANSIDLVLTSPPYLNAIDYMRCSKFSLIWMGQTTAGIREVRRKSIGCEVGQYDDPSNDEITALLKSLRINSRLSNRHKAILHRFIGDMANVLHETSRVLVPGGKAIFVVGENTIRGIYIRNAKIISKLARLAGLKLRHEITRALPPNRRYLPPPVDVGQKRALNTRMRREVVLTFVKPRIRS